jgi:hypothetical protein
MGGEVPPTTYDVLTTGKVARHQESTCHTDAAVWNVLT